MTEVSAKQPPADDVMLAGDQALRSELLDAEQSKKIHDGMYGLNGRWNTLNIDVIEKEMRLVHYFLFSFHVIGVCSPSQSASQKAKPRQKRPSTFAHLVNFCKMCLPCLIIMQSCSFDHRINKLFAYSRCVICVLCSRHTTCAKDHGRFILLSF